jgi:hypothetical protein
MNTHKELRQALDALRNSLHNDDRMNMFDMLALLENLVGRIIKLENENNRGIWEITGNKDRKV